MSAVIGLLIAAAVGYWVRTDAVANEANGTKVGSFGPNGWFAGVFLLMIVFLPIYLIQRSKALRSSAAVGLPPRGWIPDPHDPAVYRWWDGAKWTDETTPINPAG